MTSAEKEVGIIAKLVTANENLQAAIDAQQVKLDKHRSDDFESRFYEACEAVAKEKVRNAILNGENTALKSKRIAEGRSDLVQAGEAIASATLHSEHGKKKLSEFESNPESDLENAAQAQLMHVITSLLLAINSYKKAVGHLL